MGVLRFFLALSVVFTHAGSFAGFHLGDGRLAVQAFYMISGFYMSMVWTEKYSKFQSPVRTFYISRALRIYPLYFLIVVATLVLSVFTSVPPVEYHGDDGLAAKIFAYLTQVTVIGMELPVFLGLGGYLVSPVAWSLGLELTFYLIVPFLIPRLWLAVLLLIASIAARAIAWSSFGWTTTTPDYALLWSYRFFPFEIALFISGAFSYSIFTRYRQHLANLINRPEPTFLILVSLISYLCYFSLIYPVAGESTYWVYYAMVFASLWVLFQNTKHSKFDSYIGELSFPIYIVHLPLIWLVSAYVKPVNAIYVVIPLAIILSMVLAVVQRLIDNYRHAIRPEKDLPQSAGVALGA